MATDREGNTINVGDRVVLVPKIASLSGQKVVLGNRDPIKVDGEDVLIEAELGGGGGVTDHGALTGLSDPDHPAGAIDFAATDRLLGRATAGAGAGEEIPCTAVGRALLAAVSAAAQRTALDIVSEFLALSGSNGPMTGDLVVGTTGGASRTIAVQAGFSTQAKLDLRQGGLTNARLVLLASGELQLQFDGAGLGSPVAIFGVTAANLLDMKGKRATNGGDPVSPQDFATMAYVDAAVPSIGTGAGDAAGGEAVAAAWQIRWWEHWDFLDGSKWDAIATGSAAAYIQDASTLSVLDSIPGWGWARLHCGSSTGTGSYAYLVMDELSDQGRMLASTGDWRVRFLITSINTGNLKASWGLTQSAPTTLRPTNSLTFEIDVSASVNIRAVTYDGTTTNNTDTTVAATTISLASAGGASWFEIRCRSGRVEFLIDGTSRAVFTTNLPTEANSYFVPFLFCQEAGATFRGLLCDYIDLAMPNEWMPPEGY